MLSEYFSACEDIKVHLLWLLLSRRKLVPIHLKKKTKEKMIEEEQKNTGTFTWAKFLTQSLLIFSCPK